MENEATERLAESEQRYRLIADNVTDMIWTIRLEGLPDTADRPEGVAPACLAKTILKQWRFSYVSPSAERLFGYTVEEMEVLTLRDLLSPQSYEQAMTAMAEELLKELEGPEDPRRQRTLDLEHRTKHGTIRYCEVTMTFLRDELERPVGVVGVTRDITLRRQAEEKVRQEQQLLKEMLELHERDRKLLAFELHDGFSQLLTGALLNFEAAMEVHDSDYRKAREDYGRGLQLLRESIVESRRLVSGLRPPVLDEFGIVPAIEHLIQQCRDNGGPKVEFVSKIRSQRLAHPLESAIFRIVQETLTNAQRHSQSDKVRVELLDRNNHVCIMVRDWGVGFDPHDVEEARFGIKGIRERARLLGGQATFEAAPGKGALITVELPLLEDTRGVVDSSQVSIHRLQLR